MSFIFGNWLRTRRLKRTLPFILLISMLIYFIQLSGRFFNSNNIIDQLHSSVQDRSGALRTDDVCAKYFDSIYQNDKQWTIKSFTAQNSLFSRWLPVTKAVQLLRVYGQCFLTNSAPLVNLDINDLESRLFPEFTGKFPVVTRWDGRSVEGFPVLSKSSNDEIKDIIVKNSVENSFWRQVKENMNGRGIVISIGEYGVNEVKRLLKVLRVLQNRLPIQLVHKGDISDYSIGEIINAGRGKLELDFDGQAYSFGYIQDIWFVNVERCLTEHSSDLFKRFSNKWLASLFNSFEEMILMDTDAVPFTSIESLFQSVEYKETGAFFFKDRIIDETVMAMNVRMYKNLLPSAKECSLFNISRLTNYTLQNDFFKSHYKHTMESGVVVMRRKDHLPGLLVSTSAQLWKQTSEPFYGDKELFWLGQAMAGSEQYRFNEDPAGALGVLQHNSKHKSDHVCSTQLAHFDKNQTLLWINAGLRKCKLQSWEYDYNRTKAIRTKFKDIDEVKKYYESPIEVDGAVIPIRSTYSIFDRIKGTINGFKKTIELGCNGYVWCAYNNPNKIQGKTIHFNDDERKSIRFIIKVWNDG